MEQRRNDPERVKQQQDQQRVKPPENQQMAPPPPQKCPRCDSANTKFCYYNNYSLSQPRYFCKACRRYWTHGGTLRNVPVGGGCRKSKRPKPSPAADVARTAQPLPSQSLNLSQQPMRPFPGNNFYTGGSFLSSLAAMQSLNTQGTALNLGGGGGQYDALLQGVSLPSLKPQPQPQPPPHHQFQLQNDHYFPSQPTLPAPPRPSWTQSFINRGPPAATSTSTASSSFWTADGQNHPGSSFNPNHWQDSNPGFDPSSH